MSQKKGGVREVHVRVIHVQYTYDTLDPRSKPTVRDCNSQLVTELTAWDKY